MNWIEQHAEIMYSLHKEKKTLFALHTEYEKYDGEGFYVFRESEKGEDILPAHYSSNYPISLF